MCAVSLARGSAALTPAVAEPFLFGPGIFRRSFLPFLHTGGIALCAKTLVAHPSRVCSIMSSRRLCFARDDRRARFLIKNDGIPFALQERTSQSNANRSDLSVARGAVRTKPSLVLAIKIRFGRTLWKSLHGLADGWPCARCRPEMIVWMQGLHDAVNVRLGKPPFRPDSYARYASGLLERGFHAGCLGCRIARAGSRFLARAPRPKIWSR